jgi:hypothetical protein
MEKIVCKKHTKIPKLKKGELKAKIK